MNTNNLSVSTLRSLLIIFGVITTTVFYLFRLEGVSGGYFSAGVSVVALIIVLTGLRLTLNSLGGGPKHLGFQFIFFGILCSTFAQILWVFFMLTSQLKYANTIPPYLFLTTYILNFIGFLILGINSRIRIREFRGIIVGFGILGLTILTISNAVHPFGFNMVSTGYLLGDSLRIIIIALLLQMVVLYQGGFLGRYWLSIFVGNIFIFIGNFASDILFEQYISGKWPFTLIDLIFIGGYLFVAHGFYGIGDSIRLAQKKITEHK